MIRSFKTFLAAEHGAVTVDWVVLTAALVGLALAVMGVVSSGVQTASDNIKGQLETDMIGTGFGTTTTGSGNDAVTTNDGLNFSGS